MQAFTIVLTALLLAGQNQIATPEGTITTAEIPKSDGAICVTNKHGKPETYVCTEEWHHYHGMNFIEPLTIDANGRQNLVDQCPQRMRESMKAVDAYNKQEHVRHEPSIPLTIDLNVGMQLKKQWDAVIKECVQ